MFRKLDRMVVGWLLATSSAFVGCGSLDQKATDALLSSDRSEIRGYGDVRLTSREGYSIGITWTLLWENWSSNKPAYATTPTPLMVTLTQGVATKALTPATAARVVVVNRVRTRGECGSADKYDEYQYELDLKPVAGGAGLSFRGELQSEGKVLWGYAPARSMEPASLHMLRTFVDSYCQGDQIAEGQDVAVVIDGQWLVDPVNGTNNFKIDLSRP